MQLKICFSSLTKLETIYYPYVTVLAFILPVFGLFLSFQK